MSSDFFPATHQPNINQHTKLIIVILHFVGFVVLIEFIYIFGFYTEISLWSLYLNMFVDI